MSRAKQLAFCMALVPAMAWAHPGHPGGWIVGLAHPFTGWDHLLAMVGVGVLAVRLGGRMLWMLPLIFLVALAAGGALGAAGISVGPVEAVVAGSVMLLGVLLWRLAPPSWMGAAGVVAVAGLFHGFAHGLEAGSAPVAFLTGMVLASALLHGVGIGMMRLGAQYAPWLARVLGLGMVVSGGWLLVG